MVLFDPNANLLLLDPDANLLEQEQLIQFMADSNARRRSFDELLRASERLHWLRERLRAWLAQGGYEPDWSRAPHARQVYGK